MRMLIQVNQCKMMIFHFANQDKKEKSIEN